MLLHARPKAGLHAGCYVCKAKHQGCIFCSSASHARGTVAHAGAVFKHVVHGSVVPPLRLALVCSQAVYSGMKCTDRAATCG